MLLVDDILLFPIRSIVWMFRELHNAAQQELANEADAITTQLGELHMSLETGEITEAEFDSREKEFLDRLDRIEADATPIEACDEAVEEQESTDGDETRHKEAVNA